MAYREEDPWRLPPSVKGEDFRLNGSGGRIPSPALKERLRRIVNRTPEVMVKITGRTRGGTGHLKAHLDYITRNGRVHAETQNGERITDHARLRDLHDVWLTRNKVEARGRSPLNAAQSVNIILSMPGGTPPDRVEAAARTWARETLGSNHDWLMARHDDTDHAHVHISVRAVGNDGLRLAPGPQELQLWRERFARELRRFGIEAEATPRQARGAVRKNAPSPIHHTESRSTDPRVRSLERREANADARRTKLAKPAKWSSAIQARQESIRRSYLGHAAELAKGDSDDRQLARDIQRFVADMPVPLTRRQIIAVELRRVLEQKGTQIQALPLENTQTNDVGLKHVLEPYPSAPTLKL